MGTGFRRLAMTKFFENVVVEEDDIDCVKTPAKAAFNPEPKLSPLTFGMCEHKRRCFGSNACGAG